MKSIFILSLLLIGILSQSSYSQSLENELTIRISPDGKARIIETMNTPTTVSRINTELISNTTSNLLTVDENNIFLSNSQNGNQLKINSLGASHVTLSYNADIIKNDLGIWRVNYNSNLQSTVILPSLSNILSVNNIPLDIVDNVITANVVLIDENFLVNSGKITEVDKENYNIKVLTSDKNTYNLNIETYTKQFMVNIKTLGIEGVGFSKIKEGDTVHFVVKKIGNPPAGGNNNYSATKILIIPQEYFIK